MADAYHGLPITPNAVLEMLGRRCYCVSYFRPDQIALAASIALRVMIDNGAFSAWKKGLILDAAYWAAFWEFVTTWLPRCPPGSSFVIPDVIDAGTQEQDALIRECPAELLPFAWPVWHMDEPISRLLALAERFGRACIGSTAEFVVVGSPAWRRRMDEAFDAELATFGKLPENHMLRGLQCFRPEFDYPFARADSADIGRNHNRQKRHGPRYLWAVEQRINRWDALAARCPTTWVPRGQRQPGLFGEAA
jgi:hypothetical protein